MCTQVTEDLRQEPVPTLVQLLESIQTEQPIHSSFDLYHGLISRLNNVPTDEFLKLVGELILSSYHMPHETSILMLLHHQAALRQAVPPLLAKHSDKNILTNLDLRRLMLIRQCVLPDERMPIDDLIQTLQNNGVQPLAYSANSIEQIVASAFDSHGSQLIIFSIKQNSNRILCGFILKPDLGIIEPWVNLNAAKQKLKHLLSESKIVSSAVTMTYVDKAVRHFLADGHDHGYVPSPYFIQIAELLGTSDWYPELMPNAKDYFASMIKLSIIPNCMAIKVN